MHLTRQRSRQQQVKYTEALRILCDFQPPLGLGFRVRAQNQKPRNTLHLNPKPIQTLKPMLGLARTGIELRKKIFLQDSTGAPPWDMSNINTSRLRSIMNTKTTISNNTPVLVGIQRLGPMGTVTVRFTTIA